MRNLAIFLALTSALFLSGCVHNHVATAEAYEESGMKRVNVSMKAEEATVGARVRIYEMVCKPKIFKDREQAKCFPNELGEGKIISSLNAEIAVIEVPKDLEIQKKTKFEKIRE